MHDTLKFIWFGLILFCVLGLLVSIPVQKSQEQLSRALLKKRLAPQARLNATSKYLEMYENGELSEVYSFGDSPELRQLYDIELDRKISEQENDNNIKNSYRYPLYIRDRKNPKVLHKYTYQTEYKTNHARPARYGNITSNGIRRPLYIRDRNNHNVYYPVYP